MNQELKFMDREFNPQFTTVNDIDVCADLINKPHEDYPLRVEKTANIIRMLLELNSVNTPLGSNITEFDCKTIHNMIMWDMIAEARGRYRLREVTVGGNKTCPPHLINDLIADNELFPVTPDHNLIEWYTKFQKIHPFEDGNGRVGGIIVAGLSYDANDDTMLAPLQ